MTIEAHKNITQSIDNGSYFSEARAWYATKYLSSLSERVYFIIITVLAVLTCFFVIISWQSMLPLDEPAAFIYSNQDIDAYYPNIYSLRQQQKTFDTVVQSYLLQSYVKYRESYDYADFRKNQLFVRNYSSNEVLQQYLRGIEPSNPRSPLVQYQRSKQRLIATGDAQISAQSADATAVQSITTYSARVPFRSKVSGGDDITFSSWLATIEYQYYPLNPEQKEIVDGKSGDIKLDIKNTKFRVVRFDVQEMQRTNATN